MMTNSLWCWTWLHEGAVERWWWCLRLIGQRIISAEVLKAGGAERSHSRGSRSQHGPFKAQKCTDSSVFINIWLMIRHRGERECRKSWGERETLVNLTPLGSSQSFRWYDWIGLPIPHLSQTVLDFLELTACLEKGSLSPVLRWVPDKNKRRTCLFYEYIIHTHTYRHTHTYVICIHLLLFSS